MAASGRGSNGFMPVRSLGLVTAVHRFPQAAGMGWRNGRLQRQRNGSSSQRKEQQQSGDQALHAFLVIRTPSEASIEHGGETAQPNAVLPEL